MHQAPLLMTSIAVLFAIFLFAYFVVLALAFIFNVPALSKFRLHVKDNVSFHIGIPVSAVGAFGVVSVFWSVFPHSGSDGEPLSLEFLNLNFTGPSGPITLWVLCFLSLVCAMYLLSKKTP